MSRPPQARNAWAICLLTVLVAAAYLSYCLPRRAWVPHDDGVLGESATRVLAGQLPHRDFDEVYTGGLAFLDAGAFHVFGETTMVTRWVMFAFIVPTVAVMFWVALQFVPPLAAAACTLVAVGWSFATYTAAMPSWYNLIFAIFAIAAVMKFLQTRGARWLFAAGVSAGLSFDIKLSGLYLLAAVMLYLMVEEQATPLPAEARRNSGFLVLLSLALSLSLAALYLVLRHVKSPQVIYHFFLPLAAFSALVLAHEPRAGRVGSRVGRLLRLWAPVIAGFAVALLPMVIVMRHALAQWAYGLFVLPQMRFYTTTTRVPPPLWMAAIALPLIGILAAAVFARARWAIIPCAIFVELLALALYKAKDTWTYGAATFSLWMLPTPLVLLGCYVLWKRRREVPSLEWRKAALVIAVLAGCLLVQFPFSAIVYFCYIVPLVVLALLGVLRLLPRWPHPVVASALLAYFAYHAVFLFGPSGIAFKQRAYYPDTWVPLQLEHAGGLMIPDWEATNYEPAIRFLQTHATGGYTYCALDCPDVYFYSGLRNPRRVLYDNLDDPQGKVARVEAALDEHGVTAILLKRSLFIGWVPPHLEQMLEKRYPHEKKFGRSIVVRWK